MAGTAAIGPTGVLTRTATGAEPASYSFTSTGFSGVDQFSVHLLVLSAADTSSPFAVTPAKTDQASGGGISSNVVAPGATVPAGMPDNGLLVTHHQALKYNAVPNSFGFNAPAGMTEVLDQGDVWVSAASYVEQRAAGATGTRTAVFVTRPNTTTTPNNPARALSFVIRPAITATAPTVSAGADATIDQYDPFARTATENNNGATITSRAWTVQSGPNQVGATISTAAAVNWSPTVGGAYVLRYSATNSQGTGTDDVAVTVSSLNFPVTAPLLLAATRTGVKAGVSTRTAPLVLTATRTALKQAASTRTASLVLAATRVGMKINLATAPIRIFAGLSSAGSANGAFVMANLSLGASVAGRAHHSIAGGVSAPLVLGASRTGATNRVAARSAPVTLTATRVGAKSIAGARGAPFILTASIANRVHTSGSSQTGLMVLGASIANRQHISAGFPVTANLPLLASRATSSVRDDSAVAATPIVLGASLATQRLVAEAQRVRSRADTTVKYNLVCVARVPQVSGPPIFLQQHSMAWHGLKYSDVLNGTPDLSAEVKLDTLPDEILQRLLAPHELPTELWLYRNGKQVFSGPLLTGLPNGDTVSLQAHGAIAYLKMWYVVGNLSFVDVDDAAIAVELIDQWQRLEYGNFGIDTSAVGAIGKVRTIQYAYTELHSVYDRVMDLVTGGFDISVDPTSRRLQLFYPQRGVDRSSGENAVIFDKRNITSSDIAFSVAPGDLASEGLVTGTVSGSDAPLVSTYSNSELRARFGRAGVTGNFQILDQAGLDAANAALVNSRSKALLLPAPNARVTIDADLSTYDVGDTIGYYERSRLAIAGGFRTRKRTVQVSKTGAESVSLEFV